MYPTIQSYDSTGGAMFQPPQQQQQQQQQQQHVPSYASRPPANGPATSSLPSPSAAAASTFPTLRVHIAEPYRTAPPVRSALSALPPAKPANPLTLDYERKLLEDLAAAGSGSSGTASEEPREDPYNVLLRRYMDMGYSREEVAMALAIAGEETDNADKVVDCCKQYKELRSMGFKADIVVGALVLSKGELTAASEACITANMDM